jgi:hypothetical protein
MLLSLIAAGAPRADESTPAGAPLRAEATPANVALRAEDATTVSIPLRLAIQTEAAGGVVTGRFYNQLVGLRLDAQFSPRVSLGGYLGYVNLKGKDGRAGDLLPYAQLEYRTGAPGDAVRIPLRFASGYLPSNGPVVRLAAGLAFALTPRVDLVTELGPMIWVTNNQTLLSMNLALELAFRL